MLALFTASQIASASVAFILLPFDVGLHIGRWHQTHAMAKSLSSRDNDAKTQYRLARGHFLKESQNVATLRLAADDHLANGINAMDLEYRLGDVETDCRDCLHVGLL
jgi:hypothetical protein